MEIEKADSNSIYEKIGGYLPLQKGDTQKKLIKKLQVSKKKQIFENARFKRWFKLVIFRKNNERIYKGKKYYAFDYC